MEKLDSALIRPGRVDMMIPFELSSRFQIQKIFERFYPVASKEEVETFSTQIPEKSITMAELQGHLLRNRTSHKMAIQSLELFLKSVPARNNKSEK